MNQSIPEGYLKNANGHLVPLESVTDYDKARDQLVQGIVEKASELNALLTAFKAETMGDVEAFLELAAEQYDTKLGGAKGNVSLLSYDGGHKVQVAVAERLVFDERLQVAKQLVDECIADWTSTSSTEIKTLVDHAFQVDKQGKISFGRVLGLTKVKIDDARWHRAMEAIRDSMQVVATKAYLRIYKREDNGRYQQLPLDLAGV